MLFLCTASGWSAGTQVLRTCVPKAVSLLEPKGRLAGTNRLNLAIGLPLRNRETLTNLLRQIYDPASPNYHHYLTPEQFTERFGPADKDYQAVIALAKANGLAVTALHPNRMLVDLSGSVADIEKTLHVTMHTYQHPVENRTFFSPDTEPSLDLAEPVLSISGLDNYSLPRPRLQTASPAKTTKIVPRAGSGPGGAYMGNDFRAAYVPDSSLNGSGQTVGLLQFDGYQASDITYYEGQAGLPGITLSNVLIDGASGLPDGGNGDLEVPLDIEMTISMATNLSSVIVYIAPNSSPWEDVLNRMANDDLARQISCSWYQPGVGANPTTDQIFQQMAAQGQTFFSASGDSDARTGLIDFPGDTPYITQVGGTTLTTSGPGGSRVSEKVWNWGNGIGSAGGISTQYPIPTWQTNINMAASQGSTTMRNVPDVALTADNVYCRADGEDKNVGGTSCAAPLWAGFAALVNQQAAANGQPPIGFINPLLDIIGSGPTYLAAFHDITTGNNTNSSSPTNFYAVPGYDLCTGWGTPAGQNLINAFLDPEGLVITPGSGFAAIGPVGGPFNLTSQSFSLADIETYPLPWTLANTSLWLNAAPSGGLLTATGLAATVAVSLSAAASNLAVGTYSATVWFTNLYSGVGQGRQFTLNVGQLPVITQQPASQTLVVGATATFGVSVLSAGPCTYQWQLNGSNLPDQFITTVAGNGHASDFGDGGMATLASLDFPSGVAVDNSGDLFIADTGNNCIREVGSEGLITTVAGNGSANDAGDGGAATNASLSHPNDVAVDGSGNLFIADTGNHCIREVGTNGLITTVAGTGSTGYSGDGGAATNASLSYPNDVAVDGSGNLFIADTGNHCIREVGANGLITTVAGTGVAGFSGDGGLATNATLDNPSSVAVDGSDNLFIADLVNNRIRKVDSEGLITTVAGDGSAGFSGDGGPAINANLSYPDGVAVDGSGNLFIADLGNNRVRKVDLAGFITTVAGDGSSGYAGDGGVATNASLDAPAGVAVDGSGNLFIADPGNDRIREVVAESPQLLTLANITLNDAGSYTVVITNAWGSVTSSVATLTVVAPPAITIEPEGLIVTNGSPANFSVVASGTAPLVYQWQLNGTNLTDGGDYSGSATTNLLVNAATTNDAGDYAVIITNAWGSVTSSVATLTVVAPPAITIEPEGLIVTNGSPANFSVVASGTAPLVYQWQLNGTNLTDGGNYSGSATTNLLVNAATMNDAGDYTVVITNAWGSVTSSVATLTVVAPPAITIEPQGLMVTNGSPAGFSVTVSGTAPLVYQWQLNGTNLTDGGDYLGSATSNLLVSGATAMDAGGYTVIITNAWGSVTSSVAALTVVSPPMITAQPQGLIVTNGGPANFSVAVSGTAPLVYQWQLNGTNLTDGGDYTGSATTDLLLSAATTNDAGGYTVFITNAWGSVTSSVATLTVVSPPIITTEPQGLIVTNGSPANFSVAVSGTTPFVYQWELNGTNLTDGDDYSGSTTTNLMVNAATTNDAGDYTVIITNAWGSVTSAVATLTVGFPPVITTEPQGLIMTNGSSVNFSVAVSGTTPFVYQWQLNGTNLTDGGDYSGLATTNLLVNAATTNDAGAYTVIITNAWGSVTSSVATLTVVIPQVIVSPLVIVTEPQGLVVTNGNDASFSVAVSGTAPFAYQWQLDGTNLTDGGDYTGSGTTNLLLNAATTNDAGGYTVIITNAWGSVTSSVATLTVVIPQVSTDPPTITTQPQGLIVTNGSPANFSVAVAGTAPFAYQWQLDGTNLTDGGDYTGSGTTNLMVNAATTNDAGDYTVIITNAWGSVTSSVATLTVVIPQVSTDPPTITTQPQGLVVTNGSPANFSVAVAGTAPFAYQWQLDGTNLTDGGDYTGSATTNLLVNAPTTNDAGDYTVIITNDWGSVTSSVATLTVVIPQVSTDPPMITTEPQGLIVTNGSPANFSVVVSGTAPFAYQWQLDGTNLADGGDYTGPATTNLLVNAATTNDAGGYTVIITNDWGSATSSVATLTVVIPQVTTDPPMITIQPQGLIVTNGNAASFSVTVSGTAPFVYQWQLNGTNLTDGGDYTGSGTTNLLLNASTTNDAGGYTVIITNDWGSVTSSVATLTVVIPQVSTDPPTITTQPQGLVVTNGNAASFGVVVSGTAPFAYQWQLDGTNLTDGGDYTDSATTNLMVNAATTNDAGGYTVIITNDWGSVTSIVATLVVGFPPVISKQPTNQTVVVGGTASYNVTANGSAPLIYQWNFNGTNISGATNASLIVNNVQPSQAGAYAVLVTNLFGSVLSSNAVQSVTPDHYAWGQIPSPRFVNIPFSVTIQARDMTNGIFTNFTGIALLDSTNGVSVSPAVSGNFVQGYWTGAVAISQTVTNLVLRAGDGLGHFGLANPVNVVALPPLNTQVAGNTLLLRWPLSYSGFVLETSLSLSPAAWTTVPVSPIQIGGQYLVPLQLPGTNSFYRLRFSSP